jgi:hypothetical protein
MFKMKNLNDFSALLQQQQPQQQQFLSSSQTTISTKLLDTNSFANVPSTPQLVLASSTKPPFDLNSSASLREEAPQQQQAMKSAIKRIGLLGHRIQPYEVNLLNHQILEDSRSSMDICANNNSNTSSSMAFTDHFMKKFGLTPEPDTSSQDYIDYEKLKATAAAESPTGSTTAPAFPSLSVIKEVDQPSAEIKSPSFQQLSERLRMLSKRHASSYWDAGASSPLTAASTTAVGASSHDRKTASLVKYYTTMNANTSIIYQLSKLRKPTTKRSNSTRTTIQNDHMQQPVVHNNRHNRSSLNEQHFVQFNSSSLDSIDEQEMMANDENVRHQAASSDYEDMKTVTFVDFNDNYTFI